MRTPSDKGLRRSGGTCRSGCQVGEIPRPYGRLVPDVTARLSSTQPTVPAASVVVVGGGITGLAAAYEIARSAPSIRLLVVEASDRLGGVIRTSVVAGSAIEEGPDAFLARVPHAVDLCREIGLSPELVSPRTTKAYFWTNGTLRPIPREIVLGVPAGFASIAASGILSAEGLARASLDLVLPKSHIEGDVSVERLVTERFGKEVFERLVDPMLGGVYAGGAERLSAAATIPDAVRLARSHRSLSLALRKHRKRSRTSGPVFLTPRSGLERLVERIREGLGRSDVRTGVRAEVITRGRHGFQVRTPEGVPLAADAVIVTTPAFAAAPLLREVAPDSVAALETIEYASVATVTLAYHRGALAGPLDGNGFLVPSADGRFIVGCTWMTSKWPQLAGADHAIIRCAVGRAGDARWVALDDDDIVARVHAELVQAVGVRAAPVETRVSRFPRSMPQYTVGHLERVAGIEASLPSGIVVAGAGYRGIGIPGCIAQGRAAAKRVLGILSERDAVSS